MCKESCIFAFGPPVLRELFTCHLIGEDCGGDSFCNLTPSCCACACFGPVSVYTECSMWTRSLLSPGKGVQVCSALHFSGRGMSPACAGCGPSSTQERHNARVCACLYTHTHTHRVDGFNMGRKPITHSSKLK